MSKTYVMVKDNAIVKADEKLAAELRLRGYKEQNDVEPAEGAAASQPNPYTKEETEAIKLQAEILETENTALRAAAAEAKELEHEKAENPTVPPALPEDKAKEKAGEIETAAAPKKSTTKK